MLHRAIANRSLETQVSQKEEEVAALAVEGDSVNAVPAATVATAEIRINDKRNLLTTID
ncbi:MULTISPECIES: hypothetical protein [Micromonospora]|uniref:hypothetical protein n=1 Tax=Micromonospora TaxID=1873 RepID=UPI001AE1F2B5|nr:MULTISPECIES: hypothetical protein [unclassified Micromonospora]MBP1781602.1 hypothetical protein [Micromonospora sp. HB375]MBQ1059907.1 hypothetical protein [Micromonospora sp. C41]MDH6466724.1 hypothetical protein [Micromonospora sp. H404/HB375]